MTEEDEYHVDFCVGVAHVANDGTRFHFVHVVAGDDVLIARGRDQQVHVADDFVQLQYAESIHAVNNNKRMTQFLRILIGNRRRFFFFFKMYFSLMKYFSHLNDQLGEFQESLKLLSNDRIDQSLGPAFKDL